MRPAVDGGLCFWGVFTGPFAAKPLLSGNAIPVGVALPRTGLHRQPINAVTTLREILYN